MQPVALPAPSLPAADAHAWIGAPVSSRSRFGDNVWHLDIFVPGRSPSQKRLNWDRRARG